MLFSRICNVRHSFLSTSHLIFYFIHKFCCVTSHDESFRFCLFLVVKLSRLPRSIVRRNLTSPHLRRPRMIIIRFWITCWEESIKLPWSIIYHNRFPRILISIQCLPRTWWSWRRHDRWHPRSKIHHRSWFVCDSFFSWFLVELVLPLQQSKL